MNYKTKIHILVIQLYLLKVVFTLNWPFISKPLLTEPRDGAAIDLGSVEIPDAKCDQVITPYLQSCKDVYREKITNVALEIGNNFNTESVKRASCCGIWEAKRCVIKAADELNECGRNISALYERLPSDPLIRRDVLDRCSEYQEDSAICLEKSTSTWFNLNSLILFLVIIIIVTVCAMFVFKIMQRKMKVKNKHRNSYNMVGKLDDGSYNDNASDINEK